MGATIEKGKTPERVLVRLRAGGGLSPEYPAPDRWKACQNPDRLDRALGEAALAPLVLRFQGVSIAEAAGDLSRLRLEFESLLLRVPALRAHALARIELRFAGPTGETELTEFLQAIRQPFRRAAAVPVVAVVPDEPPASALESLRNAGCGHLWFSGGRAGHLAEVLPRIRALGFTSVGADLTSVDLAEATADLTGRQGLDGILLRSPVEETGIDDETCWRRIGAGVFVTSLLEGAGYSSPTPRRFTRGNGIPGLTSLREKVEPLGFGPGAIRRSGVLAWRNDPDRPAWAEAIDHGRVPPGQGHRESEEDQVRRAVIRSLLGDGLVDIVSIERRFGIEFVHQFRDEMAELEERQRDGLVECEFDRIEATLLGRLLIEDVAGCFDPDRVAREHLALDRG